MTKRKKAEKKTTKEDMRRWRLHRARQYDELAKKERERAKKGEL